MLIYDGVNPVRRMQGKIKFDFKNLKQPWLLTMTFSYAANGQHISEVQRHFRTRKLAKYAEQQAYKAISSDPRVLQAV